MNTTARALIKASLRSINDLSYGRDAGPSKIADALFALNRMIDLWNIDPLAIFTPRIQVFDLIPSKQDYTIGPSGADFTAPRPERIEWANLIMTGVNPALRKPIEILISMSQWAAIKLQQVHSSIPTKLWYEPAFPVSQIHLWPYPDQAFQLELYTWQALSEFSTADDEVILPPGYAEAIMLNLAVSLAAEWHAELRPDVASRAAAALGSVRSHNAPTLLVECDSMGLDGPKSNFNWITGECS